MMERVEGHSRPLCKFFKEGHCKFGKRCKFSHDVRADEPSNPGRDRIVRNQDPYLDILRTWRCSISQDRRREGSSLGRTKLQDFLKTAFELVNSGHLDILQRTVEGLATENGLARIQEAVITIGTGETASACLLYGNTILLPLLRIVTHPDVSHSFILERSTGTVLNFMYGIGGTRACRIFSAAARFLTLFKAPTSERRSAVVAVLSCLHNIIELNSSAKVVKGIHEVVDGLEAVLEGDLMQDPGIHRFSQRIRDRLEEGNALPRASEDVLDTVQSLPTGAGLFLERDLPGHLSNRGPRHDNDHEDVTMISILPTAAEIQAERAEYLPVVDARHRHLGGSEGLIDCQFRLLREDTIGQLRDVVRAEAESLHKPSAKGSVFAKSQASVRRFAYKDVIMGELTYDRTGGLRALLTVPMPAAILQKPENVRRQWWQQSKRLSPDALLCLIDVSHSVTFFTVCAEGSSGKQDAGQCSKLLYQDDHRASLIVRLVQPYALDVEYLVTSLLSAVSQEHVLCEFPGILLPSFHPTLKALQTMSRKRDLPFTEIISPSDTHQMTGVIEPPLYSLSPGFSFDLKSLVRNEPLELSVNKPFDFTTLAAKSSLDESQQNAIIGALTRKLALIIGPPGTGKSFTGVALLRVLLDNASKANLGPIVCVCYTNHALDQLLEHLVRVGIDGIIRVGSQSKSEVVKQLSLRDAVQKVARTPTARWRFASNRSAIDDEVDGIRFLLHSVVDAGKPETIQKFLLETHPEHYHEIFDRETDGDGFELVGHDRRRPLMKWLYPKGLYENRSEMRGHAIDRNILQLQTSDLWAMSLVERQNLYNLWVEESRRETLLRLSSLFSVVEGHVQELERCRNEDELQALSQAKVIGVTTSGLARNLGVLRRLQSKVLLCEEAGEVLEAHLLTAFLPSVEHAILIGDHQQLKPQIANFELSSENTRGAQYSLDVSLFERLLHPYHPESLALPCSSLSIQRRMHPSISALIRRTIYPLLTDHESVRDYPEVEGMRHRLFWLHHTHPESNAETHNSTSHSNDFEVELVTALVHHLIRQSTYTREDVAILTPYVGQLIKLSNRLASSFEIVIGDRDRTELDKEDPGMGTQSTAKISAAQKTSLSKAVRIATVDNFQGEEAKVVIVSLVRSNQQRKCGFLRTTNRINVLLSRAQHGMYLIGDSETYKPVPMWHQVVDMLQKSDGFGEAFELHCPRHPKTIIEVATPDDFAIKAPEGGCELMCDWRLPCGHKCINKCHHRVLHQEVFCREACPRSLAGCDHVCSLPCGAPCGPCKVQLENIELPCGHVADRLDCHVAQDLQLAKCREQVTATVPLCGHAAQKYCWEPDPGPNYMCSAECGDSLSCGHPCKSKCYTCKPVIDGELLEANHGMCIKPCGRQFNACRHQCGKRCHADAPCGLCPLPCEVRCAHSKCPKPCSEPCAPCAETCTWACPHTGACDLPCAVPCDKLPCSKRCPKILECGHQCPSVCGESCPSRVFCQICCSEETKNRMVDYLLNSTFGETNLDEDPCLVPDCGHLMAMSSMDGIFGLDEHYERNGDGDIVSLSGQSSPFSVEGAKSCPICRGSVRNINRYSRIVRRNAIDEATKKFVSWSNEKFVDFANTLTAIQGDLAADKDIVQDFDKASGSTTVKEGQVDTVRLEGQRNLIMREISRVRCLKVRYERAFKTRHALSKFVHEVKTEEQPFSRLWQLVQARRRRDPVDQPHSSLTLEPSVLQSRAYLMSSSLAIRFDITILTDALSMRKTPPLVTQRYSWAAVQLEADFSQMRQECENLTTLSAAHNQPRLQLETTISSAQLAALERSITIGPDHIARSDRLHNTGQNQLSAARDLLSRHPDQCRGMTEEADAVEKTLRSDDTVYGVVTSAEKSAVYEAMRAQFSGTGHWYNCRNGHPFTVGECGLPMQEARCPQCGSPIGGRHHQLAAGVERFDELEAAVGDLGL